MANTHATGPRDPNFPDYAYTASPLTAVYDAQAKGERQATLFMGEWVKLLDGAPLPAKGRVHVAYRGGTGYVDAADIGWSRMLELFFIDVGTGDSILIQTPDDRRILIDGGTGQDAHQFICNKYRLDKPGHFVDFEAVVATHFDSDHAAGLVPILKDPRIAVKRVFHNGLFKRTGGGIGPVKNGRALGLLDEPPAEVKPLLAPEMARFVAAVGQAKANLDKVLAKMQSVSRWKGRTEPPAGGFQFARLDAAAGHLPPFDGASGRLAVEVLWPRAVSGADGLSYPAYGQGKSGDPGKTVNGNSVVLLLRHGANRILLTGDLNADSMADLLKACPQTGLEAEVYKAAHHGSQDFTIDFVKAVRANAAVISSGDDNLDQHGHPRAVLVGSLTRHSKCEKPAVFCAELAACYQKLSDKELRAFKRGELYERAIRGVVHLRSDGTRLCLGTVHGAKMPTDTLANLLWKWDVWP